MVDVVSAVAGLVLLAVSAIAMASALRIRGRAPFVIACLVLAAANVILLVEVLSLLEALTRPAIQLGHVLLAAVAVSIWIATGRRRPPSLGRVNQQGAIESVRAHPAVTILSAFVVVSLVIQLIVAVRVCPNNWDSMTYHLSRAAYWLQNHTANQWTYGSIRQLYSPPNAEMLVAWTMSLRGTDQLASLVQWTALIGIVASIFSIGRLIGFPKAPSIFAAACFAALPQPIMQATTTQNDLVVTFFLVATVLFGIRGIRDRSLGDLGIAAASIGLAVGTKGTAVIAMPSLALIIGNSLWRFRPPRKLVLLTCGMAACGVLALGTFNYAESFRNTGTPFGPLSGMVKRTSPVRLNLGRVMWTFADSPGTSAPWFELMLRRPFQGVFGGLKHPQFGLDIDTSVQEDTSSFGLLGLIVFLPLLLVSSVRRRSPPWQRVLALGSFGYILSFAITSEWNPWIGRVLVPGIAFGAPLLASLAMRPWLSGVVLTLALAGLVPSVLVNPQKPLLVARKAKTVFDMDRLEQQTLIRNEMLGVVSQVNALVGPSAPLGYVGSEDSWDYPLFGEHRERRLVRFHYEQINVVAMAATGVVGVLVANAGPPPPGVRFVKFSDDYYLVLLAR